jgi:two-component system phosphate regulon sensor histidine kinase PhoR
VDAIAIRQALVNLLENAIKFTPSGGKVTVEFGSFNGGVLLRVRDTGIGIPKTEHKRIFERFFRVDNGLRRETNGAGIGLSLVKHIAASHRARVSVESEVGKYSVFTIQFPKVLPSRRKKQEPS